MRGIIFIVTTQVLQKNSQKEKNVGKEKNTYLCAVEEMIHIRRSEYEQLISQQEELIELRTIVRQLREEIELLNFEKSLQDTWSVTNST
jgi:DNA repair ATPase RecN